jgi:hypothetical protein
MHADALAQQPVSQPHAIPWLVAGAAVNIPWLFRAQGITDAQLLPWALALLAAGVVWVAAAYVGPMLGKSLFLLALERAKGPRLVHEHFEDIQALRRSWWLSRWLMSRVPSLEAQVPPSGSQQNSRQRRKRKRRSG